jgi:pimeloyl-ACP methyl ester carboxylesterase
MSLQAADGVRLAAVFRPAEGSSRRPPILLIHQYGSSKAEWETLAVELHKRGFPTLALDLRGHGDSEGGRYDEFSPAQWKQAEQDVAAGSAWLDRRFPNTPALLIGSSIGSSLVLSYVAAADTNVRGAALLSPGLEYQEIETKPMVAATSVSIFAVAARADERSEQAVTAFLDLHKSNVTGKIFEAGELHGVKLLQGCPEAQQMLLDWLEAHSQP